MDWQTKKFYEEGRDAAIANQPVSSCRYGYGNLRAFCAWMGGWHDYKSGGE